MSSITLVNGRECQSAICWIRRPERTIGFEAVAAVGKGDEDETDIGFVIEFEAE
jgi:hypothetical protein